MSGPAAGQGNLALELSSGEPFDVREFFVHERLSQLFEVSLVVLSDNAALDLDATVGQEATFTLRGALSGQPVERVWKGICSDADQLGTEETGRSTYRITVVPKLWLATQRRNHRMFQQLSEPDAVVKLLQEWEVKPELAFEQGAYKARKYKVQYGESDFDFLSRLLEDAGVSFYFDATSKESTLVLSDAPHANPPRSTPLPFREKPQQGGQDYATRVQVGRRIRPGKITLRDHDARRPPSYPLVGTATDTSHPVESKLERFHYEPGAFVFGTSEGDATPGADDKGKCRAVESEGTRLAENRLAAKRGPATRIRFATNALDVAPGTVVAISGHPRDELGADPGLLIVESSVQGTHDGAWVVSCEAQSAQTPYRPPQLTPKPTAHGAESATVAGAGGDEIHCDEFGRVRVHFHWDRESKMDDNSSCWIPVAQPWSGAGYGAVNLPRVGQEVIVQFLGGDPDRPVIVGRVYTNLQKVPYKLPDHKTRSGWKSCSTKGTGGYNEIMFEDEAGEEQLALRAERDMNRLVRRDDTATVGNDRQLTVGRNATCLVSESERVVVGLNQSLVVGNHRTIEVGGNQSTRVGGSYELSIAGGESAEPGSATTLGAEQGRIVLSTGGGARITLEENRIRIEADTIELVATSAITATPPIDEG